MTGHWLSVLSVLSTWGQTFYEINDSSIRFWKDNPQFLNGSSDMLVLSASKSSLDVNIEVIRSTAANAPIRNSCQSCQGLVGVFQVAGGPYAAVIIDSAECDDIGPGVRRIKELGLMKVPSMDRPVSSKQLHAVLAHEEAQRLLREAFAEHSFYFSTQPERFDVTRNTQSNAVSQLQHQTYLVENCDPRFFWNRKLAASIVAAGAGSLVVPISNIWTDTIPIAVSTDAQHNLTLVSRRSRLRQGPRFLKRGIDTDGNAANFVETEQILRTAAGYIFSFTQIRGSIPTFWSQLKRNWRLKPKIKLLRDTNDLTMQLAAKRHIQNVYNAYCKNSAYPNRSKENGIAIVNLLDKSGMQLKMGSELSTLLANLGSRMEDVSSSPASEKIREELTFEEFKMPVDGSSSCRLDYLWYDYHFNTNHFGIQKANTLYAPLREFLEEGTDVEKNYDNETIFKALRGCGNYFLSGRNGTVLRLQNGIIRTNCIDCLDRTNVVQSLFSKWMLARQVKELSTLSPRGGVDKSIPVSVSRKRPGDAIIGKDNMENFRRLWSDNGDAMSMLYAGTRALKRDITRYGRRTSMGLVNDGITAWRRFFNSNFRDEERQNGINIILGKTHKEGDIQNSDDDDDE